MFMELHTAGNHSVIVACLSCRSAYYSPPRSQEQPETLDTLAVPLGEDAEKGQCPSTHARTNKSARQSVPSKRLSQFRCYRRNYSCLSTDYRLYQLPTETAGVRRQQEHERAEEGRRPFVRRHISFPRTAARAC